MPGNAYDVTGTTFRFYSDYYSGGTEPGIVAGVAEPGDGKMTHINFYALDNAAKRVTFKGTLAKVAGMDQRVSIGDLNGDGSMDLLFTGGCFGRGDETQIRVMYGKVPNITGDTTYKRWSVCAPPKPAEPPPATAPAPAPKPKPTADPSEAKAKVYWDMAEAMIAEGQIDNAKANLERIIKEFPATTYATRARKRLEEIGR